MIYSEINSITDYQCVWYPDLEPIGILYNNCRELVASKQQQYNTGYENGYTTGYTEGETYGLNTSDVAKNSILSILNAPLMFLEIFNFEIFGINILGLLKFLLTMLIVLGVVKMIL